MKEKQKDRWNMDEQHTIERQIDGQSLSEMCGQKGWPISFSSISYLKLNAIFSKMKVDLTRKSVELVLLLDRVQIYF